MHKQASTQYANGISWPETNYVITSTLSVCNFCCVTVEIRLPRKLYGPSYTPFGGGGRVIGLDCRSTYAIRVEDSNGEPLLTMEHGKAWRRNRWNSRKQWKSLSREVLDVLQNGLVKPI